MSKKRKLKGGTILQILGVLLVFAAAGMYFYNRQDEKRAGAQSEAVLEKLVIDVPITEEEAGAPVYPDYVLDPEREMPVEVVDGIGYIGKLELKPFAITLPIIEVWDSAKSKIAPCRYAGNVYRDNMIIAGHNYSAHFGKLGLLKQGDPIVFTDIDGNEFRYSVAETEVIGGTDFDGMSAGDWDLTLFTCTIGSQSRITVRCVKDEEQNEITP